MRIITLDLNNKVISTKNVNDSYINNPGLQTGEIISDIGEIGQIKQSDGSFINDTTPPPTPQPTEEETLKTSGLDGIEAMFVVMSRLKTLETKVNGGA